MLALLDGDILVYRVGFSNEDEYEHVALLAMDNKIEEILYECRASEYEVFLTGSNNFRKKIFPSYKANRKKTPKPKHYNALRKYLIDVEKAYVSEGQEADDEMGLRQTRDTVICSIDKDMMMIPGLHYNFVKKEFSEITEEDGRKNFYRQLLTGDDTDNIPGIYGMGPKKANDLLDGLLYEEEYNRVIYKAYQDYFPHCSKEDVIKHIDLIGKLLWIKREGREEWSFELD